MLEAKDFITLNNCYIPHIFRFLCLPPGRRWRQILKNSSPLIFTFSREEREVIYRKERRRTTEQESSMDRDTIGRVETLTCGFQTNKLKFKPQKARFWKSRGDPSVNCGRGFCGKFVKSIQRLEIRSFQDHRSSTVQQCTISKRWYEYM